MRGRAVIEVMCGLFLGGLWGAVSGRAATEPTGEAAASYDFSQHFHEPLGWPLGAEFSPGKDGRKAAITVETKDVHTAPTAIRLDTTGCKQSPGRRRSTGTADALTPPAVPGDTKGWACCDDRAYYT